MSRRAEKIRKPQALASDPAATRGEALAALKAVQRLSRDVPVLISDSTPAPVSSRLIDPTKLRWGTAPPEVLAALDRAIAPWQGTPYRVGQQARGKGVDCVRFVCAVLDALTGRTTPVETLPQDAAMHARTSAILAMKKIKQLYLPNEEVSDGTIEPGDLLITSQQGGGPGHVLIAGWKPWHLWESTHTGVRRTGLGGLTTGMGQQMHYVYRITNKRDWR